MNRLPFLLVLAFIPACESKTPPPPMAVGRPAPVPLSFPDLGEGQLHDDGIRVHRLSVNRDGTPMQLWVYQPKPAGDAKRPCVFIAPAGSPMMVGLDLTEDDAGEHLPYAKAGYVVVAYSLDGHVPDDQQNKWNTISPRMRKYMASGAGKENARTAIDFALAKLSVDPDRLAIAGHSSAATHSLMVARLEPRIKACIAFAPCLDVVRWLEPELDIYERGIPGFRNFIRGSSPVEFPTEPKCPTFLFHAKDDQICKFAESAAYAAKLKAGNANLKFMPVNKGGHTDSMYEAGIPAAILWLNGVFTGAKDGGIKR